MSTIIDIPTKIAFQSCVGTIAEFPRGCGNYIATVASNGDTYVIINLSAEDLNDLIAKEYITNNQMKAIVYKQSDNTYMAYVIDDRIPKECLTPFWIYNCDTAVVNQFIRDFHKVPVGTCLCEYEPSKKWAISTTQVSRTARHKKCRECQTQFSEYYPGWHDASINPDYFEGERKFKAKFEDGSEEIIKGYFKYHDYRRHNKDAFGWNMGYHLRTVKEWQYMEQEY